MQQMLMPESNTHTFVNWTAIAKPGSRLKAVHHGRLHAQALLRKVLITISYVGLHSWVSEMPALFHSHGLRVHDYNRVPIGDHMAKA